MSADPIREQLVANCDAPRDSEAWERAEDALRDYDEASARAASDAGAMPAGRAAEDGRPSGPPPPTEAVPAPRYLIGEQTVREDIQNALQILVTLREESLRGDTLDAERLLRHALQELDGRGSELEGTK